MSIAEQLFNLVSSASIDLDKVIPFTITDLPTQSVVIDSSHLERLYNTVDFGVRNPTLSVNDIISMKTDEIEQLIRVIIRDYWIRLQTRGFGVSQIDDLVVVFIVCRLMILSIRYNIITALMITAISTFAAYLWYNGFILSIMGYEPALVRSSVTFRLGMDAIDIKKILRTKIFLNDQNYNLNNPIGVITYAFSRGMVIDGYRIDPISMILPRISMESKKSIYSAYYYMTLRGIPTAFLLISQFSRYIISVGSYAYITRVNKRYCPYLVRWHWTHLVMFRLFEGYISTTCFRLMEYIYVVLYPKLFFAAEHNLAIKDIQAEMSICYSGVFWIMVLHLSFYLYAMFHALMGQYFYIPFFTENAELHIGKRIPSSLYSAGSTAWQDPSQRWFGYTKLWYGWFGRGTKNRSIFVIIIDRLIFRPIYKLIRRIFKFFRKR